MSRGGGHLQAMCDRFLACSRAEVENTLRALELEGEVPPWLDENHYGVVWFEVVEGFKRAAIGHR